MSRGKAKPEEYPVEPKAARAFCANLIDGLRLKADKNKRITYNLSMTGICCTLATPLFVTLGDAWLYAKLVPAVLACLATLCTAWLQFIKPEKLWLLYREAQRKLEKELEYHDYGIGPYEKEADRGRLLAKSAADVAWSVHQGWLPYVPNTEKLPPPPAGGQGGQAPGL